MGQRRKQGAKEVIENMQPKTLFISAADAGYFPLLKGLILSIRAHRPDDRIKIGVLDLGMTQAQLDELLSMDCIIAAAQWDFEFAGRERAPRWLQAMMARCHLPRYFPDAQTCIWLDADVWLQDWRAIDMLERAASEGGVLAIVPELHRAYGSTYLRGSSVDPDNQLFFNQYAKAYGEPLARRIMYLPVINVGVFALRHDSNVWQRWREWIERGLKAGSQKTIEQNALNAAIYSEQIPILPLPAYCNWICGQALPRFDRVNRRFVEPILPYEPISILHVTPRQTSKSVIQTLDGPPIPMSLDYLAFREMH